MCIVTEIVIQQWRKKKKIFITTEHQWLYWIIVAKRQNRDGSANVVISTVSLRSAACQRSALCMSGFQSTHSWVTLTLMGLNRAELTLTWFHCAAPGGWTKDFTVLFRVKLWILYADSAAAFVSTLNLENQNQTQRSSI